MITPALLQAATGCIPEAAARYAPHLAEACELYGITAPTRLAAFLAQIGHESGSLRWVREIWGPTPAQRGYEGRADLGNSQPGDGQRFCGRGLVQVTGRHNYARMRDLLQRKLGVTVPDFEHVPEALEHPRWAAFSAAAFWDDKRLNALADSGEFEQITRRINGGLNGQADRLARWALAKQAIAEHMLSRPPSPAAPAMPPITPITITEPAVPAAPEPTMPIPAFIAAALPSIISSIPALAKLFGSGSEVSERNTRAAELAVQIVQEAVGAPNAQAAAERVTADPAAAKVASEAIGARWFDLAEAGGGGIEGARKADAAVAAAGTPLWRSPSLVVTVLLVPLVYMIVGSVVGLWGTATWSDEVRASLATGIVTLIIGGAAGYYWGSTTTRNRTA